MANLEYIDALIHAIKQGFSCEAKHVKTTHVKEIFQGKIAWEGEVETFELMGHPKAKYAYGWGYEVGKKADFATVLGLGPVNSPESAIKIYLISKTKN